MLRCLEAEGYEAGLCTSGQEALESARGGGYWLVLLDIAMPGLDGWTVCEALKADSALAGIKVCIVTAKHIDKDLDHIREIGADGYLLKPFKSDELLALVQGCESPDVRERRQHETEPDNTDVPLP